MDEIFDKLKNELSELVTTKKENLGQFSSNSIESYLASKFSNEFILSNNICCFFKDYVVKFFVNIKINTDDIRYQWR